MIILSDNQATDILLKKVGADNVTATMRSLGLKDLRIDRTTFELIRDFVALFDDRARDKTYKEIIALAQTREPQPEKLAMAEREFAKVMKDVSSPRSMALLLEKIVKGEAASRDSCQLMMTIMRRQQFNQRLPRYLPEAAGMAHKTGTIGSTTNDAGVMFVRGRPVVLVVFTVDKRIGRGEVEEQMGRLARVVYDYFHYTIK
jgi:beta-lactamase class A